MFITPEQRDEKAEPWLLRRDEKALEHDLHHEKRHCREHDARVENAVVQQLALCAERRGNGVDEEKTEDCERRTDRGGDVNEERKAAVRLLAVALAAGLGDDDWMCMKTSWGKA